MYIKKLTALLLSLLMVSSTAILPAGAETVDNAEEYGNEAYAWNESISEQSDVEFVIDDSEKPNESSEEESAEKVSEMTVDGLEAMSAVTVQTDEKELPEASAETSGDFEYTLNTDVDEITITKYIGSGTSVEIPASIDGYPVTAIGDDAFKGNQKLISVSFPDGLVYIGRSVFQGCTKLEAAELPDSVETIGNDTFNGCVKLASFHFPKSWRNTVNWGAGNIFRDCEKLTEITIPAGAERIPDYAFDGMTQLKKVTIPSTVKTIGSKAFRNCDSLKSIKLPDAVETIGEYAFSDCDKLSAVYFSSKLVSIGYAACYNSERLETADLPDSVESIGRYAFENCKKLASFHYPAKWEKLDDGREGGIFKNCESLTEITVPEGIKSIPDGAFNQSNMLQKLNLPSSLKKIGSSAIANCTSLKEIYIPNNVETIGSYAFENDTALTEIKLPHSIDTIEDHLFKNCTKLSKIDFPAKLVNINEAAFENCEKLENANLPDTVEGIGKYAFVNCKNLTSFHFPTKWEKVNNSYNDGHIFQGCENLTEITVPEGIKTLPDYAFDNSNYLVTLNLPSSLTKIGKGSVANCEKLKDIKIPDSVKTIGEYAFRGCGLKTVSLGDSIETIERSVFEECRKLEKVDFPKKLISIGYAAFYRCEKLQAAKLPDTVEEIGRYAFADCTSLSTFRYPSKWEKVPDSGDCSCIFENCENLLTITVPEGTKTIPETAFGGSNYLETLNLPSSLTKISNNAVRRCEKLKEINIPESVKTIGDGAFMEDSELVEVVLPAKLESIGRNAFEKCRKLESVVFSENIKKIDSYAFFECQKLVSAELPDTVETIGDHAFAGCTNLASFHYPKKWEKTDNWSVSIFENCEALKTITIPEGVKTIPDYAFYQANYLTTITLPSTLTKIGREAFYNDENLKEVTLPTTISEIGDNAFASCPRLTLYCPKYLKAVPGFIDNRLNVVSNDDQRKETPKVLDDSMSSFELTSGSKISVSCTYAVKSNVFNNASDMKLKIYIPDGATVSNNSLYMNSELLKGEGTFSEDDNHLYIPINKRTGKVSFTLDIDEDCRLQTYAVIEYYYGGNWDFDIIDIINEDYSLISLNAPDIISSTKVEINGIAPASKDVSIYVDGAIAGTVKANKAGMYSYKASLGALAEGSLVQIKAETIAADGSPITALKLVKYSAHAPEIKEFTMDYNGITYDMMSGTKHKVVFVLESAHSATPFTFSVKYKNESSIDRVYITSTRNQITKRMPAVYDESNGMFVAKGYFDEKDHDYVPGKIGVEYLEKHSATRYTLKNLDNAYTRDCLPDVLKNAEHSVTVDEDNRKQVVITSADGEDLITYTYERIETSAFKNIYETAHRDKKGSESGQLIDDLMSYGWSSRKEGNVETYAVFDKNANENQTILWSYQTNNNYIEKETVEFGKTDMKKLELLHYAEEDTVLVMKWGLDYAETDETEYIFYNGYTIDYNKAKTEIMSSSLSATERNAELEKLNDMRRLSIDMSSIKIIGAYLSHIGGYQYGKYPAMSLAVYTIDISIQIKINININININDYDIETSDTADNAGKDTDDNADDGKNSDNDDFVKDHASTTSSYFKNLLSFSIDPSGFIYEAVTNNRVSDAIVTAYWIPYDGENDSYWEKPDESKMEIWNAGEYGQENPLQTDASGSYAWDVTEGWWKVVVEKSGYEKTESEWLPVPPPQMNINLGLVSKAAPKVDNVEVNGSNITVTFDNYIDPTTASNMKVTDAEGNNIDYTLEYSEDEIGADDVVYAKVFTLRLKGAKETVIFSVPNTVKSYAGVSVEEYSQTLKLTITEDNSTDSATDTTTDSAKGSDTDKGTSSDTDKGDNSDTDTSSDTKNTNDQPVSKGKLGDLDGDNEINSGDALFILRMSVNLEEKTDDNIKLADIDLDGDISSADALEILRYSVQLSTNDMIGKQIAA